MSAYQDKNNAEMTKLTSVNGTPAPKPKPCAQSTSTTTATETNVTISKPHAKKIKFIKQAPTNVFQFQKVVQKTKPMIKQTNNVKLSHQPVPKTRFTTITNTVAGIKVIPATNTNTTTRAPMPASIYLVHAILMNSTMRKSISVCQSMRNVEKTHTLIP